MAELRNDSGALRLGLELVAQEGEPAGAAAGRLLATAGLEYHDRRDGEWWPLVRLPPLHLPAPAVERLVADLTSLLAGASQGFAWRAEDDAAIALQLGAVPDGAVVEVGVDLGAFLADTAGVPRRPEAELALFRFRAAQPELVRFSDALGRELEALRR
ncbi:MAG TPA: hypothetical protein VF904_06115 [Anaeromyxobacteraceae bacterium]